MVDSSLLFAKKITVHNEIDKIIIQKDKLSVCIDKNQLHITHNSSSNSITKGIEVYSIVGILETLSNSYLLCVGGAEYIGNIIDSNVFKITEVIINHLVHLCTFQRITQY
jgi:hypothetical protein